MSTSNFIRLGDAKAIPEWLSESAKEVQKRFQNNGHDFILIPCVNPDDINEKNVKDGSIMLGTITTDVEDATEFCIAIAGAISSYAKSAKKDKQSEAMKIMADTVKRIIEDVADMEEKK